MSAASDFDLPITDHIQPGHAGRAGLPVIQDAVDAGAEAPAGDALPIQDRLTERRTHAAEQQQQLNAALARFAEMAQRLVPGAAHMPAPAQVQRVLARRLGPLYPKSLIDQGGASLNPDLWRGAWYVFSYLARSQANGLRRRWQGEYEIDDFGRDQAVIDVLLPLAQFLYRSYWRVQASGVEHVPAAGRGLLVSNHSGVLPFDAAMISLAVYNGSAAQRWPRALVASWFPTLPFVSMLLQKTGQVQAHPLNAQRLLEQDELVTVFPEGIKGVGKPFRERYQLQRFGRGGFIKVALQTGAPILPVAVVGAEEIYPMIGQVGPLARVLGMPFFPLTPFWPWLGPLGLAPLPSKWVIEIGPPIQLESYGPRAAANPALVARLSDHVRQAIQHMLLARLAQRRSIFM